MQSNQPTLPQFFTPGSFLPPTNLPGDSRDDSPEEEAKAPGSSKPPEVLLSYQIRYDEGLVYVTPVTEEVKTYLTLTYKEDEWCPKKKRRVSKWKKSPMWSDSMLSDGTPSISSWQGFWGDLQDYLRGRGHTVTTQDMRVFRLPPPDLSAACRPLRVYQKPWMVRALLQQRSGRIGGPTRFGKTYGMLAVVLAYPSARIVIIAPGTDLCEQIYEFMGEQLPTTDIAGIWSKGPSRKESKRLTILSIDSAHKVDADACDILIADEPHAMVTEERTAIIGRFYRALKICFGATLDSRADKKDRMIAGLFGPLLSNVTYKEGVALGAIAPLEVVMLKVPFTYDSIPKNAKWETMFDILFGKSVKLSELVRRVFAEEIIPADWQTMLFIENEDQADFYLETALPPGGTIAMAKKFPATVAGKNERKSITKSIALGQYLRVLASRIYIQGLTFPDLRVLWNLVGGGVSTGTIQKPGRLLQMRPGKRYGLMVDVMPYCVDADQDPRPSPPYKGIAGLAMARVKKYKQIGYNVRFIESIEDLREIVRGAYEE